MHWHDLNPNPPCVYYTQAVELVYEASAAGLTLNVAKCRLAPATRFTFLGIVVNTRTLTFSLPQARALRLAIQVRELSQATARFNHVQAREVAQLLGLLWSAAPCCPRGVALMARGIIDVLAVEMRSRVYDPALQFPPDLGSKGMSCLDL